MHYSPIRTCFLKLLRYHTGINSAKQFGATEALGGMIGAMTIGAQINTISSIWTIQCGHTMSQYSQPVGWYYRCYRGGLHLSELNVGSTMVPDVVDLLLTPLSFNTGVLLVIIIMPVTECNFRPTVRALT